MNTTQTSKHPVIIIGAGIAGLSAAHMLKNHGCDPLILEAKPQIGGRMLTTYRWGLPLELGAGWIQGSIDNPITELVDRYFLKTQPTILLEGGDSYDFCDKNKLAQIALYDEKGKQATQTQFDLLCQLQREWSEFLSRREIRGPMAKLIQDFITIKRLNAKQQQYFEYFLSAFVVGEYAEEAHNLAKAFIDDLDFSGSNNIVTEGMSKLIQHYATDLQIKTGEPVTEIHYQGSPIIIKTTNQEFHADKVIITVPLGILKQNLIQFFPSLPKEKQMAITHLKMGILNRIYLRFEQVFWDKAVDIIGFIPNKKQPRFTEFLNLYKYTNEPILLAMVSGKFAMELEKLPDHLVKAKALTILELIYGNGVTEPTDFMMTHWGDDPYTLGSYSTLSKHANRNDYNLLASSVENKLFFAGEATHTNYPSTMHGAFLSGERAAKEVLIN